MVFQEFEKRRSWLLSFDLIAGFYSFLTADYLVISYWKGGQNSNSVVFNIVKFFFVFDVCCCCFGSFAFFRLVFIQLNQFELGSLRRICSSFHCRLVSIDLLK